MSSDDETTIASFPAGSTYFYNDNKRKVILISMTYGVGITSTFHVAVYDFAIRFVQRETLTDEKRETEDTR